MFSRPSAVHVWGARQLSSRAFPADRRKMLPEENSKTLRAENLQGIGQLLTG